MEESRRKEHQGGERFSPPWTRLSLVFARREVVFFYLTWPAALYPTPVTARLPAGRAGRGGFLDGKGCSYPKAFPLGGRCPSAHTGADEGAIWYPTFPCRKEGATSCRLNEVFLLPRWATRSPPHPSPSVTASPQGEAFAGGTPPQRNAFSPKPCSRKMRIQIRARTWAPK